MLFLMWDTLLSKCNVRLNMNYCRMDVHLHASLRLFGSVMTY